MQKTCTGWKISQKGSSCSIPGRQVQNNNNKTEAKANLLESVLFFKMVFKNPLENYSGKSQFAVFKSTVALHALHGIECYDFKELSYKRE